MYNMAETSCSSSSCSDLSLCKSSTDTSIDSSFIDTATAAYAHEPEYTNEKLQKLLPTQDISNDSSDDDNELDSSRLENLHWCKCKNHCEILSTLQECKCCQEFEQRYWVQNWTASSV